LNNIQIQYWHDCCSVEHIHKNFTNSIENRVMDVIRTDIKNTKRRKLIVTACIFVGVILLGGSLLAYVKPAAPEVIRDSLWYGKVQRGEMLREVRGQGVLTPKEFRWLATNVDGRVERIYVKPGAVVEADQVLVELSNPELQQLADEAHWTLDASLAERAALEVKLESQRLDIESAVVAMEAEYEGAKLQYQAEAILAKKNIISRIDLKRSELRSNQYLKRLSLEKRRFNSFEDSATAQLKAHQARTEQLRKSYQRRQQQVENLQIKSSIAGVVQEVPVEEGQRTTIGANIARVARPDDLIAELQIPETQAKDVIMGLVAEVDTRNGVAKGVVMRIDPRVINGTVQVDIKFADKLPQGARPDLNVDGTITLERLKDVLFVSRPSYANAASESTIFRVENNAQSANRVPVVFGRSSVNYIEVLRGLNEGEEVILSDMSNWSEEDRLLLE